MKKEDILIPGEKILAACPKITTVNPDQTTSNGTDSLLVTNRRIIVITGSPDGTRRADSMSNMRILNATLTWTDTQYTLTVYGISVDNQPIDWTGRTADPRFQECYRQIMRTILTPAQ